MTVKVAVRVHLRAARARLRWDGTTLDVWVTEPAVDGWANQAMVRAVAAWAGVRRSDVRLLTGESGPHKRVMVAGVDALPSPDQPA